MKNFKAYVDEKTVKKVLPNRSKARDLFEESERKKASLEK